jgi:hypothetical protein
VPSLVRVLQDAPVVVRVHAARPLAALDDPRVVAALRKAFRHAAAVEEKLAIAGALAAHGDRRGAAALELLASAGSREELRPQVERAMAEIRARMLTAGINFKVQTHDAPFYDHAVAWDRPQALIAAVYYPRIRGLNFYGFMVDPVVDTHAVKLSGVGSGTPFNLVNFCESGTGTWTRSAAMVVSDGGWYSWPGWTGCARWYVMIGQAAAGNDDTGQVITVNFRGT